MPVCFTRKDYLNEYRFPVEPARDFELDGIPAHYASGHPKDWGQEPGIFDFGGDIKGDDEFAYMNYFTALSPDKKLLAISTRVDRVCIYDVASKELRQVLDGAGSLEFRPLANREGNVEDTSDNVDSKHGKPAYTLVSSISNEASPSGPKRDQLVLWDLDQHGRVLDEEEPMDSASIAAKAIDAIAPELTARHEWTKDFIDASALHAEFARALNLAAAKHRRWHNTILNDATLGGFGSTSFSSDGRLLLYHSRNRSTQHGMREPNDLPHVVIHDIGACKDLHRLSGHTDAIMWSAFSPDNEHVASVSWDGTLRMYSACTGELAWVTEDSGGQSWAGAFSPDSKHIVWSSNNGRVVQLHDVADGRKISTFQENLIDWCRCLVWHPIRKEIALCVGTHAYIWDVFDGPNGRIVQHFEMDAKSDYRGMTDIRTVSWMDEGRLLCLQNSDGTNLVYDTQSNAKELFRRPMGAHTGWRDHGIYGLFKNEEGNDFYLSVDGDGKVRYWHNSVAAYPSWWEKKAVPTALEKRPFPETGKYVKITKKSGKGAEHKEMSGEA